MPIAEFPHSGFQSFFSRHGIPARGDDQGRVTFAVDGVRLHVISASGGSAELFARIARLPTGQRQQDELVGDILNAMASQCGRSACRIAVPPGSRDLRLILQISPSTDAADIGALLEQFMTLLDEWRKFVASRGRYTP